MKNKFSYLPLPDEPSIFTEKVNKVNREWVVYVRRMIMGKSLVRGTETLGKFIEFINRPFSELNAEASSDKIPADKKNLSEEDYSKFMLNNMAIVQTGITVIAAIKTQLKAGVKKDGFETPASILTPEGHISMRWVMHTAREDNMTPEEAYAYAQVLIQ